MATATISESWDFYTVTGGTINDRVCLEDIQNAVGSDLSTEIPNVAYSAVGYKMVFPTGSFFDLTGGRLILPNDATLTQSAMDIRGDVLINAGLDEECFELHLGERSGGAFTLFGFESVLRMPSANNRFKVFKHLTQSGSEPGVGNQVYIQNNSPDSSARVSFYGAAYSNGENYVLPAPTGFKPNGTFIIRYEIEANVPVRDLEISDGYVDFRPRNNWAPPTRGVFRSKTWMKWLGILTSTLQVFGNATDAFSVIVDESGNGGAYFLHGLVPPSGENQSLVVYNNFAGLDWATQLAVYSDGREIQIQNHLQLNYSIIDEFLTPVEGADLHVFCKEPMYPTGSEVNFNGPYAKRTVVTDATGEGFIGTDDGISATSICIEAFAKSGWGGDIDLFAYSSSAHSLGTYANAPNLKYSILKYGNQYILKSDYNAAISGSLGDGKQTLGVLQAGTDREITQTNYATALAYTSQDTTKKIYDHFAALLKANYDDEDKMIFTKSEGQLLDTGSRTITIQAGTGQGSYTQTTASIFASTLSANLKTSGTVVINNSTLSDCLFDGDVAFTGTTGDQFTNVTCTKGFSFTTGGSYTAVNCNFTNLTATAAVTLEIDQFTTISGTRDANVTVVAAPSTLTITGIPINGEVRVYKSNGTNSFGDEIAGIEDNPTDEFVLSHNLPGQDVIIQVISYTEGFEEFLIQYTLQATNQTLQINLNLETNI